MNTKTTSYDNTINKPLDEDCFVCSGTYNITTRSKIICPFCDYSSCQSCYQKYMLTEAIPKCMKCFKEMTPYFLRKNFSNRFISTNLKSHQQNILFEQELSILPTVQYLVEIDIKKESINHDLLLLNQELLSIKHKITDKINNLNSVEHTTHNNTHNFIRPCSDTNCRGFLNNLWKCGTCLQSTCRDCHCFINNTNSNDSIHVCDPNNVLTASLIISETKPCPKCKVNIFKIDGCDHMWCTQCHLPFSWKTGTITEKTSNPHYYEWLRTNNNTIQREDGDYGFDCGGQEFVQINYKHVKYKNFNIIENNMLHLFNYIIPIYSSTNNNDKDRLRVAYLRKQIGRVMFINKITTIENKHRINSEYLSVFNFVRTATKDINVRINNTKNHNQSDIEPLYQEYQKLFLLANELLADIGTTYKVVPKIFNIDGKLISSTSTTLKKK